MNRAVPTPGQILTVDLHGERIRVTVGEIVDDDHFRATITMAPLGKSHNFKIHDQVLFRRAEAQLGDSWEAVDENKLLLDRLRKETAERDAKEAKRARA